MNNLAHPHMRPLAFIILLGSLGGIAVCYVNPLNNTMMRLVFIGSILSAWICSILLIWNQKKFRYATVIAPILLLGIATLLTARPTNQENLEATYLIKLKQYIGTIFPEPRMNKPNVLFVCGKNQWRSHTAESIYKNAPRIKVRSAGAGSKSKHRISPNDL